MTRRPTSTPRQWIPGYNRASACLEDQGSETSSIHIRAVYAAVHSQFSYKKLLVSGQKFSFHSQIFDHCPASLQRGVTIAQRRGADLTQDQYQHLFCELIALLHPVYCISLLLGAVVSAGAASETNPVSASRFANQCQTAIGSLQLTY